jgi:sulfopyruvate decarboxylase TPP-binding subunit
MIETLFNKLETQGYNFFTGVPDSALKLFQNDIISSDYENIIATNEGQSIGIAFGAELAGKKSCVYLQNSGLGNIINPLTSLCMPFDITPLLVIGHRHTLEQHKIMGETDEKILQTIGYTNYIIIHGDNNVK